MTFIFEGSIFSIYPQVYSNLFYFRQIYKNFWGAAILWPFFELLFMSRKFRSKKQTFSTKEHQKYIKFCTRKHVKKQSHDVRYF